MFKFLFLLFISLPAFADEWTSADTKREAVYLTLHTIDWAQTRNIARNPDKWRERNAFLGEHPAVGQVDRYFALTGLAHVAISKYLPAEYRKAFQYVTIGHDLGYVTHNFSLRISAKF